MINATLYGRLGKDAELRATSGGLTVASFSVASDRGYKDNKKTTWVSVAVFGKTAEFAAKLRKGERVVIAGAMYLDEWTNKEGVKVQTLKLDASVVEKVWEKSDGSDGGARREPEPDRRPSGSTNTAPPPGDDDIPF